MLIPHLARIAAIFIVGSCCLSTTDRTRRSGFFRCWHTPSIKGLPTCVESNSGLHLPKSYIETTPLRLYHRKLLETNVGVPLRSLRDFSNPPRLSSQKIQSINSSSFLTQWPACFLASWQLFSVLIPDASHVPITFPFSP